MSLFTTDGQHHGLQPCLQIPGNSGRGHTAIIHTRSQQQPQATFTQQIPVSPALVHGPSAHGCTGLGDGLTPSRTLGCRTYDGTFTTENVTAQINPFCEEVADIERPIQTRTYRRIFLGCRSPADYKA